jgi:hypothetical protein
VRDVDGERCLADAAHAGDADHSWRGAMPPVWIAQQQVLQAPHHIPAVGEVGGIRREKVGNRFGSALRRRTHNRYDPVGMCRERRVAGEDLAVQEL